LTDVLAAHHRYGNRAQRTERAAELLGWSASTATGSAAIRTSCPRMRQR